MKNVPKSSMRLEASSVYFAAGCLLLMAASSCTGLVGYEKIVTTREAVPGAFTVITATCAVDKKVLGGGFHGIGDDTIRVSQQFPQDTSDANGNPVQAWQVGVTNGGASPRQVTAYALCAE